MAKKKSNPHSEDNHKPTRTQHQIPDDDASEKLDSLKSLNAMLLKETVERRHQVDSLTQINGSLESELNRCISDKVSLESELDGLSERAVRLEIEKGLVCRFVSVQVNEMAELNRKERTAMEERIGGLEGDVKRVLKEKDVIERVKNKKELEIGSLNNKLNKLVAEFNEEKLVFQARIDEQSELENGLRSKLGEVDKRKAEISEKCEAVKAAFDRIVHEKMEMERNVDLIMREKDLVERKLAESNGLFIELKRDFEKIMREKKVIEEERNTEERKKNELNKLVHKLQKGQEQMVMEVSNLEEKCVMGLKKELEMSMKIDLLVKEKQEIEGSIHKLIKEKSLVTKDLNDSKNEFKNTMTTIKRLESEIVRHKAELDQATMELKNAEKNLNNEKLTVNSLHEKISKMEKGIEETHKLVTENNNKLKNSIVKTRKEHEDTKAKLRRSEANITQILTILKNLSSICDSKENDNMGIDQETEFGEDISDHITEVEAIKKAFKMLKFHAAKGEKRKRFWKMVSSATTVLAAAVSLAYVNGGSH